jgi:hypothetical protein
MKTRVLCPECSKWRLIIRQTNGMKPFTPRKDFYCDTCKKIVKCKKEVILKKGDWD